MILKMLEIFFFTRGIDDDEEVVVHVGDHQVVEDAAIIVGEETVALTSLSEAENIDRHEAFQRQRRVLIFAGAGAYGDLAHMRNVEQAGGGAGPEMFPHHAGGILHRHVVAGKRHHAGSERQMQGVKRGLLGGSGLVQMTPPGFALD